MVAQLKYVRSKSQDTFRDIYEMDSRKAASLGTELKRPESVSRQEHRDNVPPQSAEELYYRSIFVPFNDNVISQSNNGFIKQ
jgi:hypothetical protein